METNNDDDDTLKAIYPFIGEEHHFMVKTLVNSTMKKYKIKMEKYRELYNKAEAMLREKDIIIAELNTKLLEVHCCCKTKFQMEAIYNQAKNHQLGETFGLCVNLEQQKHMVDVIRSYNEKYPKLKVLLNKSVRANFDTSDLFYVFQRV